MRNERGAGAERLLPVIQKDSDHPCFECAKCCTYVAIEIENPSTNAEYDQIVWYLYHQGVEIFVDWESAWHVLFRTRCENLTSAGMCGVYDQRPAICKDFDWRECEQRFTPEDGSPDKHAWVSAGEFIAWFEKQRPRAFARYREHLRKTHAGGEDQELLRVKRPAAGRRQRR
ncbi:MAG: YkgJ family cysteine cluster protein [Myxococcota bacterium]